MIAGATYSICSHHVPFSKEKVHVHTHPPIEKTWQQAKDVTRKGPCLTAALQSTWIAEMIVWIPSCWWWPREGCWVIYAYTLVRWASRRSLYTESLFYFPDACWQVQSRGNKRMAKYFSWKQGIMLSTILTSFNTVLNEVKNSKWKYYFHLEFFGTLFIETIRSHWTILHWVIYIGMCSSKGDQPLLVSWSRLLHQMDGRFTCCTGLMLYLGICRVLSRNSHRRTRSAAFLIKP